VPTYQYACTECDHSFEQFQSFTDDALTECPQCHGRLRKLFNAVGVVFKGSGFYRTDSRASESGSSDKKDSGSKSDSVEGSSDKKPSTTPSTSTETSKTSSTTTSSTAAAS
jgi:putative FmdB family regulatory protein